MDRLRIGHHSSHRQRRSFKRAFFLGTKAPNPDVGVMRKMFPPGIFEFAAFRDDTNSSFQKNRTISWPIQDRC